jgi:hypothetical protein
VIEGRPNTDRRDIPSPFSGVVSIGYYDGPTDGLLWSASTDGLFKFCLLDWDDGQDRRVYGISHAQGITLDDAIRVLSRGAAPTWPVWLVPGPLDAAATDFLQRLARVGRPVALIVTLDLLGPINLWRDVAADTVFQKKDWLTPLGFPRSTMD